MAKRLKNLPSSVKEFLDGHPLDDEGWAIIQAYDHRVGEFFLASEWLKEMMETLEEDHREVVEQRERVKALDEALNQMVQDNPWLTLASVKRYRTMITNGDIGE